MNYVLLLRSQTTWNCHNFERSLVRQSLHNSTTMFIMLWVFEALHCSLNLCQHSHVDTQSGWAANWPATTQASQPPSELVHLLRCQPNPTSQTPNCLQFQPSACQLGPVTQFIATAGLNWPQLPGCQRWRFPAWVARNRQSGGVEVRGRWNDLQFTFWARN